METDRKLIWKLRDKGQPCAGCPHESEVCLLKAEPSLDDVRYNLVFLFEKPTEDGMWRGRAIDSKMAQMLVMLTGAIDKTMSKPLQYSVVFAVGRASMKAPLAKAVDHCAPYAVERLVDLYERKTQLWGHDVPHVVVAFGAPTWRTLGLSARAGKNARGKTFFANIRGARYTVVPAHSLRHLHGQAGILDHMCADVRRAVGILFDSFTPKRIEDISADYLLPTTEEGVEAAVKTAMSYTEGGYKPSKWPIALDFETNSLNMYLPGSKPIAVSAAWAPGKSAGWLLDHRESAMDRARVWAATIALLTSPNPKIWHHRKFDLSVEFKMQEMLGADPAFAASVAGWLEGATYAAFPTAAAAAEALRAGRAVLGVKNDHAWWDTLLAEHHIEEGAQGLYGLKPLAFKYAPEYGGYEAQLQKVLLGLQRDLIERAAEFVDYPTARTRGLTVDLDKAADLYSLEDLYVRTCFEHALQPKASEKKEELAKEKTRLRSKIKNRYKHVSDGEAPPTPKVDVMTSLEGVSSYEDLPVDVLIPYAAVDTDLTRIVCQAQHTALREQTKACRDQHDTLKDCQNMLRTVYMPGVKALARAEYKGIGVDTELLATYKEEAQALYDATLERMHSLACTSFNPNSHKDLMHVFTEVLEVPWAAVSKTPSGLMSTSAADMAKIGRMMPGTPADLMAHLLLLFRSAKTTLSTYLSGIELAIINDGRIHAYFGQHTTVTGRLSVSGPSLQNYPVYMCRKNWWVPSTAIVEHSVFTVSEDGRPVCLFRVGGETFLIQASCKEALLAQSKWKVESFEGFAIKRLLIPDPGMAFFNGDISSAEVRILCGYMGNDPLVKAMRDGLNAPSYVAARVFGKKYLEQYVPEARGLSPSLQTEAVYAFIEANKDTNYQVGKDRTACKRVLYGTIYGAGDEQNASQMFGFLADEGTPERESQVAEAASVRADLFAAFPRVPVYIKTTEKQAGAFGRVRTNFGRYRRFPFIGYDRRKTGKAHREAVNFRIQAEASDAVVVAAAAMQEEIAALGGDVLLLVHDAIAGQIPFAQVPALGPLFDRNVLDVVSEACPWVPVPYAYDLGVGTTYKTMVDWGQLTRGELSKPADLEIAEALGYGH